MFNPKHTARDVARKIAKGLEDGTITMENDQEKKDKLWKLCEEYIDKQDIICPESVYQSDRVILNAYDFIEKICDIVGYKEYNEDD